MRVELREWENSSQEIFPGDNPAWLHHPSCSFLGVYLPGIPDWLGGEGFKDHFVPSLSMARTPPTVPSYSKAHPTLPGTFIKCPAPAFVGSQCFIVAGRAKNPPKNHPLEQPHHFPGIFVTELAVPRHGCFYWLIFKLQNVNL